MKPSDKKHATRGSALISALFIMTLVAIAATAMGTRLQLDIYRTRMTILSDKIYLATQAVTFWSMSELSNKKNTFTVADSQGVVLRLPPALQNIYPTLNSTGIIYDLQARFNLNNLNDSVYLPVFNNLMDLVLKNITQDQKKEISLATHQWIRNYQPEHGKDPFMGYYLKQDPPYYPAYQLFTSISEFRLIQGVNSMIFQSLSPFIVALPETTPINFNTATKTLLRATGQKVTEAQVNQIIEARGKKGLTNLTKANVVLNKLKITKELFTVKSQYFLCVATVGDQDLSLVNYAVLKRIEDKKGNISISLVEESINTL